MLFLSSNNVTLHSSNAQLIFLFFFPSDFLSYCMFAFSCFRVPDSLSIAAHAMRLLFLEIVGTFKAHKFLLTDGLVALRLLVLIFGSRLKHTT